MPKPLGYFITWGTYGARLHGDPRGTVHRLSNEYGTPIIEDDPDMLAEMQENLKYDPVVLSKEQMWFIEATLPLRTRPLEIRNRCKRTRPRSRRSRLGA